MATAGEMDRSLECHICAEQCIGPRKLPECGHICCETCILIYVSKLKDDGNLDIGFPCPKCEVVNPGPKDLKAAIGWIKSLEKTEVLQGNSKENTKIEVCSSCLELGRSTKAVKFCLDCYEGLCQMCTDGRHTYQTLRGHKVIDTDFGDLEPRESSSLFQMICELTLCDDHPENPIIFFCNDHETYGCEECIDANHKQCSDVVKTNAVTEDAEVGTDRLKASIKNLCDYAQEMTEIKTANIHAHDNQIKDIIVKLKAIRGYAIQLFDIFEENNTKQAKCIAKKHKTAAHKDEKIIKDMTKTSALFSVLLEKLAAFGSQSQTDVIVHKIKKRMKGYEETMLNMSGTFKETRIKLKQEDLVLQLLNLGNNNTQNLATITEINSSGKISAYQSQLLLWQRRMSKVKEWSTNGKFWNPAYSYVAILRNGQIVLKGLEVLSRRNVHDDQNAFCILIKQNEISDSLRFSTKVPVLKGGESVNKLLRRASKKEDLVAVPAGNKILIVSANEKLEVKWVISTNYQPNALQVLRTGDIAVAWNNPVAFGIISVGEILVENKVYFRRDRSGRQISSFDYIAVDETRSNVIQPCNDNNAVYCFDFQGYQKFQYNGIESPRGVALDHDCNIFACSNGSNSIHVISPTGTGLRILEFDYRISFRGIAFSQTGEEFVVTEEDNPHCVTLYGLRPPPIKSSDSVEPIVDKP